ncbi:conserved repeat domain-containing protein/gliding motility-associated C-terminal domain-containing protein [Algoriphagus faecimaris]|uniref:Conserved repeat domain-containing protein/gliding motility-associated C-terminal domain-containing protein n=1 Tax=Algoriphagus faecimaris TaxID=686796 RepID=A0A1G6M9I5_9BACT|nr:conserved repeat domain-containing protein/gliding motility-associated C-terminal domain-containing protein [Algoriphagus faecimaris]
MLFFGFLFLTIPYLKAQVRVPFTERSSLNNPSRKTFEINGDFALIGNTNLSLANYDDNLMNDNLLLYVDVDQDPNTINSSSASLTFSAENGADPNCTQVLFAGLYWSGRGPIQDEFTVNSSGFTDKKLNRRQVTLSGPSGDQQVFTASPSDIRYTYGLDLPNDLGLFVGYVEVTDFVRNNGVGEYTVADLAALEGTNYHYGGWSMVVVYENPQMKQRSVTVFDGYAFVRGSVVADYTLPISGFATVDSGPVRMKLGVAAGEGDVAATGDYLEIEKGQGSNDFVRLSHGENSENNFFNSSIATGGNPRNPNLKNNTGMDIAVFDIPNADNEILENGQTSTRFRYGTDGDAYVIYSLVTAVETSQPLLEGFHYFSDSPASEVVPGDEIELTIEIRNTSEMAVEDALLTLNLPQGLEYVSAETVFYSAASDNSLPGFDDSPTVRQLYWDIGDVPIPNTKGEVFAEITYKVKVTGECALLINTCSANFVLDGELNGINGVNGNAIPTSPLKIGVSQGSTCFDTPIFGPLEVVVNAADYLKENCGFDTENSKLFICQDVNDQFVQILSLTTIFPAGTRFYDEFPILSSTTEYVAELPLDSNQSYFAVFPNNLNCPKEFSIEAGYIEVEVEQEDLACGAPSSESLVSFKVVEGKAPFTFDYLDGLGPVNQASRSFAFGSHQVVVSDANGCQRTLDFEVSPSAGFSLTLEKNEAQTTCPDSPSLANFVLIESESEENYTLTVEGKSVDGADYLFNLIEVEKGRIELPDILPGMYKVTLVDGKGCFQEAELEVKTEEYNYLKAEFELESESISAGTSLNPGEEIDFINLSEGYGALVYSWDFGDGEVSSEVSPIHSYEKAGKYTIRLTSMNETGCIKEVSRILEVGAPALRMPNAFTPNGDGKNDFYFPVFRQIDSIQFWIFNRWGETLYFSDSLTDTGWDGSIRGEEAPSGTYIYRINYWSETKGHQFQSGSFLLLK